MGSDRCVRGVAVRRAACGVECKARVEVKRGLQRADHKGYTMGGGNANEITNIQRGTFKPISQQVNNGPFPAAIRAALGSVGLNTRTRANSARQCREERGTREQRDNRWLLLLESARCGYTYIRGRRERNGR